MKNIIFLFILTLLPSALSAQTAALAQLGGLEAVKAEGMARVFVPEVSAAAQARSTLAGKWLGWGEWTFQGSGAHCYMDMEFEEGADYLFRKGGYFDCGTVNLAIEPARFVRKGTQLFDQAGQAAGSYENNVITLYEAYSAEVAITTVIKVDGLHFDYSEIWRRKNGAELYNIQGRLFTGG